MAWSPDPELHQMFLDELDQRSGRLATAARALAAGDDGSIDLPAMRREGHTIKGTARVMGYEAIGSVAVMLEEVWDGISTGDVEADADLGDALAALCVELELAGRENPETGTPSLRAAAAAVHDLVPDVALPEFPEPARDEEAAPADPAPAAPEPDPDPPDPPAEASEVVEAAEVVSPAPDAAPPPRPPASLALTPGDTTDSASRRETDDRDTLPVSTGTQLGPSGSRREPPELPADYEGFVEAIGTWSREGTVTVNAGRLYRLINRIVATRADAEELAASMSHDSAPGAQTERARAIALTTGQLQSDVLGLASLPLSTLTTALPQVVKYLAKKLGKNVEFEIGGDTGVLVGRRVLEMISEPIRQLVVNAIYHGLEIPTRRKDQRKPNVGSITLDVALQQNMLEVVVADDGAGVDWEFVHETGVDLGFIDRDARPDEEDLVGLLFEPGFTTGALEGGEGDGLARLAAAVEALHGRVQFETWPGDGTRVTVRVPAWEALRRVFVVSSAGMLWALPAAAVAGTASTAEAGIGDVDDAAELDWEGSRLPVVSLARAAGLEPTGRETMLVAVSHRVGSVAFGVDSIEGTYDVAVADPERKSDAGPSYVDGVVLLGDEVALVVDAGSLVERTRVIPGERRAGARVLVVEGPTGTRMVLSGALAASGFSTSVVATVPEALEVVSEISVEALVVDHTLATSSAIALVEEVRRHDRRIPIVMIADRGTEEDRVRAKQAGVDRFFAKAEFREGALAAELWSLLEARGDG